MADRLTKRNKGVLLAEMRLRNLARSGPGPQVPYSEAKGSLTCFGLEAGVAAALFLLVTSTLQYFGPSMRHKFSIHRSWPHVPSCTEAKYVGAAFRVRSPQRIRKWARRSGGERPSGAVPSTRGLWLDRGKPALR